VELVADQLYLSRLFVSATVRLVVETRMTLQIRLDHALHDDGRTKLIS
jgi:hypothetical protein